jgi:hypothetical protein
MDCLFQINNKLLYLISLRTIIVFLFFLLFFFRLFLFFIWVILKVLSHFHMYPSHPVIPIEHAILNQSSPSYLLSNLFTPLCASAEFYQLLSISRHEQFFEFLILRILLLQYPSEYGKCLLPGLWYLLFNPFEAKLLHTLWFSCHFCNHANLVFLAPKFDLVRCIYFFAKENLWVLD